jgi:hypothetical protein
VTEGIERSAEAHCARSGSQSPTDGAAPRAMSRATLNALCVQVYVGLIARRWTAWRRGSGASSLEDEG